MESIIAVISVITATASGDPTGGLSQRAPLWRDVNEITLACDDRGRSGAAAFCEAALEEARRGAPYPVRLADGSAGPTTFALRLSMTLTDNTRALAITGERAETIDEAQGSLLPRITRATIGEPIERTLARAFDAALPWRGPRAGTVRAVRN